MSQIEFAELISKIAHELRSPLTSIKGFSSTLVKRWDRFDEGQRLQFVETILADAERMGRIVSEVLDLARLETGRLELHPSRADLQAIAKNALAHVSQLPGAERVNIDVPADLTAWADPDRLERILSNLVENAIKFSDEGPITVTGERDKDVVRLSVSDRGVGIEKERLGDIFSGPSSEARAATPHGSGLGLYLTDRLVRAHGGTLEVKSQEGAGSTFTVELPVEREDSAA